MAELVGAGVAPLPSRDALTAVVQPGPDAAEVARHIDRYLAREDGDDLLDLYCSAWPVVLDTNDDAPDVTAKVAARAVLALRNITVRDLVVARLTPGALDVTAIPGKRRGTAAHPAARGMGDRHRVGPDPHDEPAAGPARRLCAMTPDSHAAPPLSVLASWAWWRGDGALARVALERALRCEPDYRLALLLERLVDLAIRPHP